MVDARRARRILQRIAADLVRLDERAKLDRRSLLRDVDRLAALKYFFITAIEGCIDVAQHLCASESFGTPSSNADAVRLLGAHGVLAEELAAAVARAVGFRNVLVHGYAEVDDERVVARLDDVRELEQFVAAVAAYVDRHA